MKFTELAVLLPCHSLEDFPIYHESAAAQELLTAWTALWHPAFLAAAESVPTWHRVDLPPDSLAGRLVTLPPFCAERLPAGFIARAKTEGGWLVQQANLSEAVAEAIAGSYGGDRGVSRELVDDFLALGFCRLQVELLTRQMRYTTNIDETHFRNEALAAAAAAVAGDEATAREHLAACFETLYESRKHFYPVDVYLLDFTLVAETTLGPSLRQELAHTTPSNLLMPSGLLAQLKASEAESFSQLLTAIDAGRACVTGGEPTESELPLLPMEDALARLAEGVSQYESVLGRRPQVFARRRAGLWPTLPQMLAKLGYQGALHFTLDDGRFPLGPQSKTRWEGLDSSVIDIFAKVPSDAARSESFLGLSRNIADSMDNDHVATVALAHWPGAASPWYDILRRVTELSPVLGKFMLLDEYFNQTDMPGRLSRFTADEYRTPYLKQAIIRREPNAISRSVQAHRAAAQHASSQTVRTMAELVENHGTQHEKAGVNANPPIDQLASAIARRDTGVPGQQLIVNPLSFTRRIGVELTQAAAPPQIQGAVVAADWTADRKFAVVEVPAMGFAWIEPSAAAASSKRVKPITRDNTLSNEFFEITVSRKTGGISSLVNFKQRGNQFSQQLAFRLPAQASAPAYGEDEGHYTQMRCESLQVTAACSAFGEITTVGTLVDDEGRRISGYRQKTQVWAGSRIIRVEIELDTPDEPRSDPWNSYYAARFAWAGETADLYRGVGLARQHTEAKRFEAPEYIEIDNAGGNIAILTGGLPYHRRSSVRMLDTLLVVAGETARRFALGIAVDAPHPAIAATEFIAPPATAWLEGYKPTAPTGWLFHVSAKNVVATRWEPLVDVDELPGPDGRRPIRGFKARLLETAGNGGRVTLRAFRPVVAARQVDFLGQTMVEVQVDNDKMSLDFAAFEWIEAEAVWS